MIRAILLMLALAAPAAADNVFPAAIEDEPMQRNLDFLYEEYSKFKSSVTANSASVSAKSTWTIVTTDILATATMGPCLASFSTITRTDWGSYPLEIELSVAANTDNNTVEFNVLMDGAYIENFTATRAFLHWTNGTTSTVRPTLYRKYRLKTAVSAGTHNFCVTMLSGSASHGTNCSESTCELVVTEYRGGG